MQRSSRITLDHPDLQNRIRASRFTRRSDRTPYIRDFHHAMPDTKTAVLPPQPPQKPNQSTEPFARIRTNTNQIASKSTKRPDLPRQSRSVVLKREMVKTAAKKYRAKHRMPLISKFMVALSVVLFVCGLGVMFTNLRTNRTAEAQVKQQSQQISQNDGGLTNGLPSEDLPPGNHNSYNVAPDLPRFFKIEKINVDARVLRLGVGLDNILKAPANIYDVGWYDGSAKPGEAGTVVLDGHVSGPTKRGVFYNIGNLKPGDKVQLERGDGRVFTYTVTGSQTYDSDKVDMPKVLTSSVPGKPALNFMTCTGRFDVRKNSFEQRIVVFAVQDN